MTMKPISQITGSAVLGMLLAAGVQANTIDFTTPSGSSDSDGPVSAEAIVTAIAGGVTVTLNDFLQNPKSAGQLVSGLEFNITDTTGGASVGGSSGILATIGSGGSYTPGTATSLSHWAASLSGSTVTLTTLSGGQPNQMIIGPDSAGGFAGLGLYNNANASIHNFNPSVLGTATFTLSIPGVTALSTISGVNIEFGTGPEGIIGTPPPSVADGGSTVALLGIALLGVTFVGRKLRTN